MPRRSNNVRAFHVVQFIELPFEGIGDYVCVPYTWLIVPGTKDQKAVVAYPKDEDPFDTRDRVKRKERYNDEWRFYTAAVKYESETYRDAEYWIATRNANGPLVEGESKIIDTQPRFTLNKKLRSANQSQLSKSNENTREPLPGISIKRPALSDSKKKLDGKRLKLDETAQSSSEPGCSNREESIITQDNQSMECIQTQETAAAYKGESSSSQCTDQNLQESLPTQEQQQLIMPLMDDDTPTVVIDGDKEIQPTRIMDEQLFSIQVLPQFAEQLVQNPQISVTPSMEINNHINNEELRTNDVLNNESTSHHLPDSLKMSAHLYSHMNGARRLVPIQKPVEKRLRPVNFLRNSTIAAQTPSNLIGQTGSLSMHSVVEQSSEQSITQNLLQDGPQVREIKIENSRNQTAPFKSIAISSQKIQHVPKINVGRSHDVAAVDPRKVLQSVTNITPASQNLSNSSHKRPSFVRRLDEHQSSLSQEQYRTHSYQNQSDLLKNQDNLEQELLSGTTESNNYKQHPNSTIRMRIPSIRQNSTHSPNPSFQTAELSQQRQTQLNQQGSQRQPQRPKIRIGISIKPKNKRIIPTHQGTTKKTTSLILTKVLHSLRKVLSTTHNNDLVNEQQKQACQSEGVLTNENHLNEMDKGCQTEECLVEETLSSHHALTSDSDALTDHEVISDHEVSTFEMTNNVHCTGIASEKSSADRLTAAQNLPTHQTHPRVVLEQQMLDNFATLFTQMGSTLRYTCDMYHNLRSSISETADTYRNLLDAVERFNAVGNSASNASSLSNLTPVFPQATEQNHTEVTARASSSNESQHNSNVAVKVPKKKHNNLRRFALPPNYDSHDTKWTLKYPRNLPGLVELMPRSGIYISYGELKYCEQVSKDCKSLARLLLREVFNRNALSVCLSMNEKVQASNNVGSNARPNLDAHASTVLLDFVLEYGLQCGWNTDLQPILHTLHNEIQKIRFKYGLMVI